MNGPSITHQIIKRVLSWLLVGGTGFTAGTVLIVIGLISASTSLIVTAAVLLILGAAVTGTGVYKGVKLAVDAAHNPTLTRRLLYPGDL